MTDPYKVANKLIEALLNEHGMADTPEARLDVRNYVVCGMHDAIREERERCAKIAESEPEPEGEAPEELSLCQPEEIVRGTVRATRQSIAARIRSTDTSKSAYMTEPNKGEH